MRNVWSLKQVTFSLIVKAIKKYESQKQYKIL